MNKRKYTGNLGNGFIYNDILDKPQTRKTITPIYNILGKEYMIEGNSFNIRFDNTDHFEFWCTCNTKADILRVEHKYDYSNDLNPIFFILGCNNCGKTGQSKIYCKLDKEIVKESYCNKGVVKNE